MPELAKGETLRERAVFFEKTGGKPLSLYLDWRVLIPPAALVFVLLVHTIRPVLPGY
jgi:hypothetical protein